MKLVVLNGAPCSGKSSIIKNVMERKEYYFYLSHDSLKWQFSQYSSGKYYEDIYQLRLAMLRALCELKYNVITESTHRKSRQEHIDVGISYGYEIVEINLEAEYQILSQRFDERISNAAKNKDRFNEFYTIFQNEKNPSAVTFKTDMQSIEEVSEGVLKLL